MFVTLINQILMKHYLKYLIIIIIAINDNDITDISTFVPVIDDLPTENIIPDVSIANGDKSYLKANRKRLLKHIVQEYPNPPRV